jgi:predicted SprT family Zn-dependent metalloprotease
MNISVCEIEATKLMREHGLSGWRLEFDRSVKRFGQMRERQQVISLSAKLVGLNPWPRVRQTVIHEIAHALAGASAGHGAIWKRIARELGHSGSTYYSLADTVQPPMPWQASCGCNTFKRARRPRGIYACRICKQRLTFRKVM